MASNYLNRRIRTHSEATAQTRVDVLVSCQDAYLALRLRLAAIKAEPRSNENAEADIQEFLDELDNAYSDSLSGAIRLAEGELDDASPNDYEGERSMIEWKQAP